MITNCTEGNQSRDLDKWLTNTDKSHLILVSLHAMEEGIKKLASQSLTRVVSVAK